MGRYRVNKFEGVGASTLGFNIEKPFSPEMDLRAVGYWDATNPSNMTMSNDAAGVPRIDALRGAVGQTLVPVTGRRPAARLATGAYGIGSRSDMTFGGTPYLPLPTGQLPVIGRGLMAFTCEITTPTSNFNLVSTSGAAGTGDAMRVNSGPSGFVNIQGTALGSSIYVDAMLPTDGAMHCVLLHHNTAGQLVMRIDGVQRAAVAVGTTPLFATGALGAVGAKYDGAGGINNANPARIGHLLFADVAGIPEVSDGASADIERDRNAATYWEAALMWKAGIQSRLPTGHPFKTTNPITTWVGERA